MGGVVFGCANLLPPTRSVPSQGHTALLYALPLPPPKAQGPVSHCGLLSSGFLWDWVQNVHTCGGKGFKETSRVSGERAASFRKQSAQAIRATPPPPPGS